MKKEYLENFLKSHLEDEFELSLTITDVNGKAQRIRSTNLHGRDYLNMLNFGINTFTETLSAILSEAIIAELPEEEHMNFYKKDNSEEI